MKYLFPLSFILFLIVLAGCGERTVDVTFHDETTPPPTNEVKREQPKAVAPVVEVVPDFVGIEAQMSDWKFDSKRTKENNLRSVAKFTLSLAQFTQGFPHAIDLSRAESFQFRSKYNKGCDTSTFRFAPLSPNEPNSNEFVGIDKGQFDADCNHLLANFTQDMRVDFTNVPLVKDPSKIVAAVTLHMIKPK